MDNITSNYKYEEHKYNDFVKTGDVAEKMTTNIGYVDFSLNELVKGTLKDDPARACDGEVHNAVPVDGTLTFTGYPDEILRTLRTLLDGRKIEMTVDWTVIDK